MDEALKIDPHRIYVVYGRDPVEMVRFALEKLNLRDELTPDMRIALKPNLVVSKPASSGATTSPEILEGIIQYLHGYGLSRITIMESSAIGYSTKDSFRVAGIEDLAGKYKVELKDLKESPVRHIRNGDFELDVFEDAFQQDYLINIPVVKAHCQTGITCALKNLKGLIPDREKRRFHRLGLHRPIADLNAILTSNLVIADGIQGDLMFEEGGNPVRMDRVLIGKDPVLMDSFVANSLGYRTEEIPYIKIAQDLGVGNIFGGLSQLIELNRDLKPVQITSQGGATIRRLSQKVSAREACSVCYGNLLHALYKMEGRGGLERINGPVFIGQGYKGKRKEGVGIGNCTREFSSSLPGCPPDALQIIRFLEASIARMQVYQS
jgi:uncharacterized protein (DUF362 family)